jgi:hypothetical protein
MMVVMVVMVVMDVAITDNGKNVENHVGRHGGAVDTSSRTRRTADQHISRDPSALPMQAAAACGNVL